MSIIVAQLPSVMNANGYTTEFVLKMKEKLSEQYISDNIKNLHSFKSFLSVYRRNSEEAFKLVIDCVQSAMAKGLLVSKEIV